MGAILEFMRSKPYGLWMLDDDSPFTDYSGYNRNASVATTPENHIALVNGAFRSVVLDNTSPASFESPVFIQGQEFQPFSLTASFRTIEATSEQQVLGNANQMDGLTVDGTIVSFVTKYENAPEARAAFDVQISQNITAVGVHSSDKNSLYINGVLVSEYELTDEQKNATYVATTGTLYSGHSSSSQQIAVNCVGIFAHVLPSEAVKRQFDALRNHMPKEAVPALYGGVRIPFSQNLSDVFLSRTWQTAEDWNSGVFENVVLNDSRIQPEFINDVSVSGSWTSLFPLDADVSSIYGVNVLWDGEGAVVEASLDGITWETVTRGKNLSIVPPGFNPTDKAIELRVSFPGGIDGDTSFIDNLTITGFSTGSIPEVAGRKITYTSPAYVRRDFEPLELRDDWGVELDGGQISIGLSNDADVISPYVLEIWYKNISGTLTTNFPGTEYVNGVASAADPVGQWVVKHIVSTGPITNSIFISGGENIVGQVALYPQLTPEQIADIYARYTGTLVMRGTDNSSVGVTETAGDPEIYAYDWAIQPAG